jgi:hypothetical protein
MSATERPGGLTALAVINFIFGGFGVLGVLVMLAAVGLLAVATVHDQHGQAQPVKHLLEGGMLILTAVMAVNIFLLIGSGVGYLQQKRILGRYVGNTYAVLSLGATLAGLTLMHQTFGISSMIGMVYPLLTLYLLNVVFRDDLVN